jgi:hypothetical protein
MALSVRGHFSFPDFFTTFATIALKRDLLLVHVVKSSNSNSRFDLIDLFCKSYFNYLFF